MQRGKEETILSMNDTDAEFSILSTLIRNNELWGSVSDILHEDVFYSKKNRVVFKCIKGVIEENGIADVKAISNYHKKHPDREVSLERYDFVEYTDVNPVTFKQNVDTIVGFYKHRKVWEILVSFEAKTKDYTEDIDEVAKQAAECLKDLSLSNGGSTLVSMNDVANESLELANLNLSGGRKNLRSGFKTFDDRCMLRETTLTIIAAFSSVGKSALALNIAENVARGEVAVAYYTKEMANVELFNRMVAKSAGLTANIISNKKISSKEKFRDYEMAANKLRYLPIYFDQGATTTFEKTLRSIREVVKLKDVKLIIIDYLQIFAQTKDGGEEGALGYMARELKNIAKELNIAVIALSQISRPAKANDKSVLHPRMRGLRGSGQLEESADNVVLIDRPEVFQNEGVTFEGEFQSQDVKGKALLIASKCRGSSIGSELVGFEGEYTRFYDIDSFGNEEKKNIGGYHQTDMTNTLQAPSYNAPVPLTPPVPNTYNSNPDLPF